MKDLIKFLYKQSCFRVVCYAYLSTKSHILKQFLIKSLINLKNIKNEKNVCVY